MLPEVKEDILTVLMKLLAILRTKEAKDALEVKELSSHVIHDATLFEDKDALSIAVLVYGFSKVMQHLKGDFDYGEFSAPLENALKELRADDLEGFRALVGKILRLTSSKDAELNLYVNDVLQHSKLKNGCKVCEHGVSCAKSAELLDISQWELMQYLGRTTRGDHLETGHDIRSRLAFTRELFS